MELTIEDIRTLQLAVDNMADDGMTDEGVKKLLVLHAKLEVMATRLTKRAVDVATLSAPDDTTGAFDESIIGSLP